MKKPAYTWCLIILLTSGALIISGFYPASTPTKHVRFPYKKAGLTEREAAAHLLDRFTYGATPGMIDTVVQMGLENWFNQQLEASLPDDDLNNRLSTYGGLQLTNTEVCHIYLPGFVIRTLAIKDSVISKDSVDKAVDKKAFNAQVQAYMDQKGYKSDQDLYKQFIDQNILRAAYSRNQLQQVMTDFWFNHFNVSFTKGECAQFIPAYERDVIRPNALGKFDQLLIASAQSPAMLYYLDNFTSVGAPPPPKPGSKPAPPPAAAPATQMNMMMMSESKPATPAKPTPPKPLSGLNENYAREVMELHTLGVDGGYNQHDVTEAARVLTGWTVYYISDYAYGSNMKALVEKIGENNLAAKGYIRVGDFLFTPNRHDHGEKKVLGQDFPANNDPASGYQEGIDLLEMLAHHPSAAHFLSKKLAVRFVSDTPPASLIDKMAKTYKKTDGDIKQVLLTMVSSPEFWDKTALREKTKSPFELAISAVRSLRADIKDPYPLYNWITRMGEKKYYYLAPTGWPDRSQYWVNAGALLNRMDFSLALTSGQVGGIKLDIKGWTGPLPPGNLQGQVATCSKLLLPEVDPAQTVKELMPLLNQPGLTMPSPAVNNHAPTPSPASEKPMVGAPGDMALMSVGKAADHEPAPGPAPAPNPASAPPPAKTTIDKNNMVPLIAGIIIGSPEYQRR